MGSLFQHVITGKEGGRILKLELTARGTIPVHVVSKLGDSHTWLLPLKIKHACQLPFLHQSMPQSQLRQCGQVLLN